MDAEKRKQEIRERLRRARFPRRDAARLADDVDHNPWILEDCAGCRGAGRTCHEEPGFAATLPCSQCDGDGIGPGLVRFFTNPHRPITVVPGTDRWLRCPACGMRFSLDDRHRWSGWRHVSCGQRLSVVVPQ